MSSIFGMESALILRSDKKNMTGGGLTEWKTMAAVSLWAINWPSEMRAQYAVVNSKVTT